MGENPRGLTSSANVRSGRATCDSGMNSSIRIGPLGVEAALEVAPKIPCSRTATQDFDEFSLKNRVALVSGANRGFGLEMAIAHRAVYCIDVPSQSGEA